MRGGEAIYTQLTGRTNRWGKLPVTIYDEKYVGQVALDDFSMTTSPGRSYRYFSGTPLYEFGYGLSYTTFNISCTSSAAHPDQAPPVAIMTIDCDVRNTGRVAGDEVLMVYHRLVHAAPSRSYPAGTVYKHSNKHSKE